jgi:hypothetical protein
MGPHDGSQNLRHVGVPEPGGWGTSREAEVDVGNIRRKRAGAVSVRLRSVYNRVEG